MIYLINGNEASRQDAASWMSKRESLWPLPFSDPEADAIQNAEFQALRYGAIIMQRSDNEVLEIKRN